MPNCTISCAQPIQAYPKNICGRKKKDGGIPRFIFLRCNAQAPTSFCDVDGWIALKDACQIQVTPPLLGSKPAISFTKQRLDSESPEESVGGVQTLPFRCYSTTKAGLEIDFWNHFSQNAGQYLLAFRDNEGQVKGFVKYSMDVSDIYEDTKNGSFYIEGTATYENLTMLVANKFPEEVWNYLTDNIDKTCDENVYLDDQSLNCESIIIQPEIEEGRSYEVANDGSTVSVTINTTRLGDCDAVVALLLSAEAFSPLTVAESSRTDSAIVLSLSVPVGLAAGTYRINVLASGSCDMNNTTFDLVVTEA